LSFEKQVANVGLGNTLFGLANEIAITLVGVGFVWTAAFVEAASIVYQAITAMHLTDFEDAISDPSLWSAVRCCIFNAIKATGYVTEANFPSILTCLGGISYTHADVVSAIHDYVQAIGWHGLAELSQPAGTGATNDCADCGGSPTWCRDDVFGHATFLPYQAYAGNPYTPGVGYTSWDDGVHSITSVEFFIPPTAVGLVSVDFTCSDTSHVDIFTYLGGSPVVSVGASFGGSASIQNQGLLIGTTIDRLIFQCYSTNRSASEVVVSMHTQGAGLNPIATNNC
jgi:hypothetical protein